LPDGWWVDADVGWVEGRFAGCLAFLSNRPETQHHGDVGFRFSHSRRCDHVDPLNPTYGLHIHRQFVGLERYAFAVILKERFLRLKDLQTGE
jgi:hypothetical protein